MASSETQGGLVDARTSSVTVPLYVQRDDYVVFGILDLPASEMQSSTGVLIVPPFGWDEVCSHRSRRDWAQQLVRDGHPALRIDLPGAGDSSGSPRDPARVDAWTAATVAAAAELRALAGCERIAAIGIGLGGLVLYRAICEGAPVDDLVLWAVPSRGRAFLRELRVFASLEDSAAGAADAHERPAASPRSAPGPDRGAASLPDGYIGAGGFVLSAETASELQSLDLTALAVPAGAMRRVLLLERDGIAPDARLREHLQGIGANADVAPGPGYGEMMAKPEFAQAPTEVFEVVEAWLREGAAAAGPVSSESISPARAGEHVGSAELRHEGVRIEEAPLAVAQPFGQLLGIVAEPVQVPRRDFCLVLLNAGAIRRIGPSRMWVEAARRWAARGVPVLRLDLEGIGDADGSRYTELAELYVTERIDQVTAALDALQARGAGSRFVLAGLCSGAHWSFHTALRDERVSAVVLLNPRTLFWSASTAIARDFRRGLLRRSSWRRVLQGEVPLARIAALAARAPIVIPRQRLAAWRARRAGGDELDNALDRLRDAGVRVDILFSENEPLREELELGGHVGRIERWPNTTLGFLPDRDHTLRPFDAQRAAHEALDRALERELSRLGGQDSRP